MENIKCPNPKCGWIPDDTSKWVCSECKHEWNNTFETFGRCPECKHIHYKTLCPKCTEWSNLNDWYQKPNKS